MTTSATLQGLAFRVDIAGHWERSNDLKYQLPVIFTRGGGAKSPEKKGTTKTRRHKVFFGPAQATPGRKKRLPLCLGVFVVQGFYAFCDSL